jgi:hypothetical protein
MAAAKKLTAAILARRASKGSRGKRTRPGPRQYTVADLERARDRVAAAERRIDNDHTSNPDTCTGPDRRCWPARLDLGEWGSSRLVATAAGGPFDQGKLRAGPQSLRRLP